MHLVLGSLLVTGLAGPAAAEVGRNTDVLNPNQASVEQLVELPHITEAIAKQLHDAIPFLGMTEVHKLLRTTLSDEQCAELYKQLFIPLNLNAATREEIMLVPGIGKKMAHEFEEYRPYEGMARFRREMGKYVDDDEVARLEQYVFVPIDLNTASDADILSIPGVGKRMLHEFKEYRPYKDIAQFRREIGKYVDEKELARLERYVTLGETAAAD
jgi:DNA uptake protein ComE-like DNA-binding protein